MLVTPRPGINRNDLLASLTEAHTIVFNMRGSGAGTAYDRLLDYLDWTNHAATVLASQISSKDLDRLVLTRRYELLLSGVGTLTDDDAQRVVNGLVLQELKERTDAFDQAIKALRSPSDAGMVLNTSLWRIVVSISSTRTSLKTLTLPRRWAITTDRSTY